MNINRLNSSKNISRSKSNKKNKVRVRKVKTNKTNNKVRVKNR